MAADLRTLPWRYDVPNTVSSHLLLATQSAKDATAENRWPRGGVEFRRSCLRACDGWRFRSDVCETTVGPWARPPLGASGGPEPENESDPETASNLQQSLRGPNILAEVTAIEFRCHRFPYHWLVSQARIRLRGFS